jgi:hypothetical protein
VEDLRHAWLARQLIDACGGPLAAAQYCRLEKSRLSECQNPRSAAFLPVDVVADLEAYCGEPIYSRALFEARPGGPVAEDLVAEACEEVELAAGLQALVRKLPSRPLARADREHVMSVLGQIEVRVRALMAHCEQVAS